MLSKISDLLDPLRTFPIRDVMGATIVVTEHGRQVARLVPEADSLDDRISTLRNAGSIHGVGGDWAPRNLGCECEGSAPSPTS